MVKRESALPKWAQAKLEGLRRENQRLLVSAQANGVTADREWYSLPGPGAHFVASDADPTAEGETRLFTLAPSGAHLVTVLYPGDVLLVGRYRARTGDAYPLTEAPDHG